MRTTPRRLRAVLALACATAPAAADPLRYAVVGALRFSFLSDGVLRVESAGAAAPEDRPTVTFPSRLALPPPDVTVVSAADPFVARTSRYTVSYDPRGSSQLGCAHLNVTVALPGGSTTTSCVGAAAARVPLDPDFPGVIMDDWREIVLGDDAANLNGSLVSYDCYVSAQTCVGVYHARMQMGLVSTDGVTVVDDSGTALLDDDADWRWRIERNSTARDLYVFAFGHDYVGALADFVALSGPVPLKPWRTHGVWSSREFPYTDATSRELVADYASLALPLHVFILDYGWHHGPYQPPDTNGTCHEPTLAGGRCLGGYGGYVWEPTFFPNPRDFVDWLHDEAGLMLGLNIHDQCGIDSCQTNYQAIAIENGINGTAKDPVQCRYLNKSFSRSLSELVLETGDLAGVDFYWMDYGMGGGGSAGHYLLNCSSGDTEGSGGASGGHCMRCFDDAEAGKPTLWTSYVRNSRIELRGSRGMSLAVYGGLGHHRWPSVGSGDAFEGWDTLAFQVYASVVAANVGIEWSHASTGPQTMSHHVPPPTAANTHPNHTVPRRTLIDLQDLGGFNPNPNVSTVVNSTYWLHCPELYVRWLQHGTFQPLFSEYSRSKPPATASP